jgi:GH24 family phage-related lysozyme (muramidase)
MTDFHTVGEPYTKANEGCTLTAKKDSRGYEIGYGHNNATVIPGMMWTQAQAEAAFATDYGAAANNAQLSVPEDIWNAMGIARQAALVDMAYELGLHGLRTFVTMRKLLEEQRWSDAADDLLKSLAASQAPARWQRHAEIFRVGDAAIAADGKLPGVP